MRWTGPGTTLVGTAVVLAALLLPAGCAPSGPRSSGTPTDADYCNVLLMPALAEAIGLDDAERLGVARKGSGLLGSLLNRTGHNPIMAMPPEIANEQGVGRVNAAGQEARAFLPDDARREFERLFSAGTLVRVRVHVEKGDPPLQNRVYLTYGWWKEEKDRTELKSLSALHEELSNSYRWIADADEANRLLEHPDDDVRGAAKRWLDKRNAQVNAQRARERRAEKSERLKENFERARAEAEAFRQEVEARQKAAQARMRADRDHR